ncbi:MAG: hypothetical protein II721_06270 [Bacilli bacterium]|nr:hypothetical protein [Bacilli bacterium]
MVEDLSRRIDELEEENRLLNEELSKKEEELKELDELTLDFNPRFPLSTESLSRANANLDCLNDPLERILQAKGAYVGAQKKIVCFQTALDKARSVLQRVKELDKKENYDDALIVLSELKPILDDEDFAHTAFLSLLKEIAGYERCALLTHKGEKNVAKGELPMEKEQLNAFRELAQSLTTIANPEALKDAYVDEAFGLRYCLAYRKANLDAPSLENFRELREAVLLHENNKERRSSLTLARAKILCDTYAKMFNRLSYEYFENEPNYDKALEVFLGRDVLPEEKIEHYAYKENKEEKEFYFAFVQASALKKDLVAYRDWVLVLGQKASAGDELSFEVICHLVSMPLLDATKFDAAISATKGFDFVMMLKFLEEVDRLGCDPEKEAIVFEELSKKNRVGDFEKMAPSLNYLNFHIDSSLRKKFDALRLSLLRSPKAHRVKIKSSDENVHLAFGEEKTSYRAPVGKPLANQTVKAWGGFKLFMFWLVAAVIPVLGGAAAIVVMKLNNIEQTLNNVIYIAPMLLIYFALVWTGLAWLSRDEWGSARFRRFLMLLATLVGVPPLIYWIAPASFAMFSVWSLPLFITSWAMGILSLLIFRERKSGWRYFTFILFVAVDIAASVFFVLAGVNGLI